ncbi:MAG: sigma-54 dependent transcriptional regulator, partial [Polyangiaceae bacterium]
FSEQELTVKVAKAIQNRRLTGEVSFLATEFKDRYKFENIVGQSRALREVLGRIVRTAPTDAIVLITGESGTGKELVAKAIHANSRRSTRPYVPVNCAAITESLLESELFGHAKGAFTGAIAARKGLFEEADGGTFFFDEIAETPLTFQAKLLRVIQEQEIRRVGENKPIKVDVRIVAATNQNLMNAIAEKRFRQDLYYRLNVVRFELPPLRQRREDVPELLAFFMAKYNKKIGVRARIHENAMEALMSYDFPGNVRELEHMVEQAVALVQDGWIMPDDILPPTPSSTNPPPTTGRALSGVVDSAERNAIESALRDASGSREKAAETLGISPTTLWRKMTRLGISFD